MLGKDFISGAICLLFFLTRTPCRVVTTSVDHAQLQGVLWGEIRRFLQTSRFPLDSENGGPLVVNHLHIRKVVRGEIDGLSYLIGRVAERGEGMSGHHIAQTGDGVPRTLGVADEASGIDEVTFQKMDEWANRRLIIGNPYECQNTFKWAVKGKPGGEDRGGDIKDPYGPGYLRKIIRIKAEDSPNVRLAQAQLRAGVQPTNEILVPGVLPFQDYVNRRATWDASKQCSGLDADFYEGASALMFPPEWLNRAETVADELKGRPRRAEAVGVDPGEGESNTAMYAVDHLGIIARRSKRTPDTDVVPGEALAFAKEYGCEDNDIVFDRGGGGKQMADRLRAMGYAVRTVAFGEAATPRPWMGRRFEQKLEGSEGRYEFKNRRAEMYWQLRECIKRGWGVPREFSELRRQLAPIPLTYDNEGRVFLLPKNGDDPSKCLSGLIGCSPDEADAAAIAVYGMQTRENSRNYAGAL